MLMGGREPRARAAGEGKWKPRAKAASYMCKGRKGEGAEGKGR